MNKYEIGNAIESAIAKIPKERFQALSERFSEQGMVFANELVPAEVYSALKAEVVGLLEKYQERIDIRLRTTENSPRKMTIISHRNLVDNADLIRTVYENGALNSALELIAGERVVSDVSEEEVFKIIKQHKAGDTHGWHWGDYSFALIWVMETPPINLGGMLQCIPHTSWNKENPGVNRYIIDRKITTYGFTSGDLYFLRTDTTLHRTVELSEDALRIVLNMTWGTEKDIAKAERNKGNQVDTFWHDKTVAAATPIAG